MKMLGDNLKLRLLSLFVAVILWIYVINVQNPEIKREFEYVPVNIINADTLAGSGLVMAGDQSFTTTVKVEGKQEVVNRLTRNDIEAVVDLKDYNTAGKFSIPIKFSIPGVQGVEVSEGKPHKIELRIEKLIQAQKAVVVEIKGNIKEYSKYQVKSVRPNTVSISGPQSLVESIGSVKVPVDVTNHENDISVTKRYRIFNKGNVDITESREFIIDSPSVQVDIDYLKTRDVPVVPKLTGRAARDYYISGTSVKPDKVNIYGHPEKLEGVKNIYSSAIDILGLDKDIVTHVSLVVPTEVNTDFNGKVQVSIFVRKKETRTVKVPGENIELINKSENYSYKVLNSEVELKLLAQNQGLNSMDVESLKFRIDVEGLNPGEHELPVSIEPSGTIEVDQESPGVKLRVTQK